MPALHVKHCVQTPNKERNLHVRKTLPLELHFALLVNKSEITPKQKRYKNNTLNQTSNNLARQLLETGQGFRINTKNGREQNRKAN